MVHLPPSHFVTQPEQHQEVALPSKPPWPSSKKHHPIIHDKINQTMVSIVLHQVSGEEKKSKNCNQKNFPSAAEKVQTNQNIGHENCIQDLFIYT